MTRLRPLALALALVVVGLASAGAHKTVVSPFTFNRDVRPILERRCAACHAAGSGMPLVTYKETVAQSWPIRQALVSGRMPPALLKRAAAPVKDADALTPRELDTLITWAAGGTPEGTPLPRAAAARPAPTPAPLGDEHAVSVDGTGTTFDGPRRLIAIGPLEGPEDALVSVIAESRAGTNRVLLAARVQQRWPRRYAFVTPFPIAAGTRLFVTVVPPDPRLRDLFSPATHVDRPAAIARAQLVMVD